MVNACAPIADGGRMRLRHGMRVAVWRANRGLLGRWCRDMLQRGGQRKIARSLDAPHLVLALLDVSLSIVVHPKAQECHGDSHTLYGMNRLTEPDDGDDNDHDALDEAGDRICHRGCAGENGKCDDVLRPMDRAVHEEVIQHTVRVLARLCGAFRPMNPESPKVGVEPDRDHENKGKARRVEQKVELVELVCRGRVVGGHDLLEEDIRRYEDDG